MTGIGRSGELCAHVVKLESSYTERTTGSGTPRCSYQFQIPVQHHQSDSCHRDHQIPPKQHHRYEAQVVIATSATVSRVLGSAGP